MQNPRAHELAERLAELNGEIIRFVQECPKFVWESPCPDDGRPVGVVAHHIASSHAPIVQLLMLMANGEPVPSITAAMLDQANAHHAAQSAGCTPDEVVELLRARGREACDAVRSLRNEQLSRRASGELFGARMSTEELVENVLLGHAAGHFARIKGVAKGILASS